MSKKIKSVSLAEMFTKPNGWMTPEGVKATGRQFGQKIGNAEAKKIAAVLKGWRS